ncbi:MAG: acetylornithine deacetylase [Sphingomonas sp.]|jgi:acetylornithine deacetylase|uniref:acetylornithine deacetylase n=1 Tax=unclassified Sphingomonas TaxID=196159 RepID=UPI000F89B5E9|nr:MULTISPECIES: acetylornithine deacetylase [unclassified Sphingomonas]MDR6849105.1 acetylornithine deacetylase [Sphingomonas sp. BE137]MDR7259366.1 acetylornithine deacetylase [Sphingomonas sp. BE270]RUN77587.1 acetylornithine deacetylase [Sphingomonas sp. TF3]
MTTSDDLKSAGLRHLEALIGFDTTSRDSNLALIGYVENVLRRHGVPSRRVSNADQTKANLYATIGPAVAGGVVLSGHTDVVPVDGQAWTSDPFILTQRGERLYGRGTCDMKAFLALALAVVPRFANGNVARPLHLAFSYDEEVGCLGAPSMIRELVSELPAPLAVIVGEPTNMEVVSGHKGISTWRVTVKGHEAHSSLTHLGVSANMVAVGLMAQLRDLAESLERHGDPAPLYHPPHATLTIGLMQGGTAVNILARECSFVFDLRTPPGQDPDTIMAPFLEACAREDGALRARFADAGVSVVRRSATPSFAPEAEGAAETLARRLAGDNGPARAVPYAAEAGQFQGAGFSTVICGPGSIEQAHQPDEYLEVAQFERGAAFMARLVEAMS